VLLTGKHAGHAFIRSNREVKPEGQYPIPEGTVTIARLLRALGYVTGAIGKWGLGPPGSSGDPNQQGFGLFYGYNCQRHAHNHYPQYLWRNDKKVAIDGNPGGATGKQYAQDLFEAEALRFIQDNKDRPFFLYLPFIVPHVALQVPEDSLAQYKGKWQDPAYEGGKGYLPHPHPRAAYAAMITRMDRSVGRILDLVHKLGLDEHTIIMFSSDNGGTHDGVGGSDSVFFGSNGPLRGFKGSLHEGGIRVPFIVRWLGKIKPGQTSELPCAAYDVLPTLCELAGTKTPKDIDGISLVPTLLGKGKQQEHEFLYWEFPGYGGQQAVRLGNWKGIRKNLNKGLSALELYDLASDIGETKDLAKQQPKVVERILRIMTDQRTVSKEFPMKVLDAPAN
jgi:arylsulfatase